MAAVTRPHAQSPVHYNVGEWVKENEQFFLPPVCNKMMHDTQLKVFYVGGPNQRKDFHLEEGEELFFMRKGDMCLKILEAGKFRDIHIKEGEVFLLPAKIPHSPQRGANTVGLVIERERLLTETDGLRYFVQDDNGTKVESLFERWFYCDDLGSQLGPVIREFFASEQYKTGKPILEDIPSNPPWVPDSGRQVQKPFSLAVWMDSNMDKIRSSENGVSLFDNPDRYQSDVLAFGGTGSRNLKSPGGETFLWQVRGESEVRVEGDNNVRKMSTDDTLLVPEGAKFKLQGRDEGCVVISTLMNPKNKDKIK